LVLRLHNDRPGKIVQNSNTATEEEDPYATYAGEQKLLVLAIRKPFNASLYLISPWITVSLQPFYRSLLLLHLLKHSNTNGILSIV